MMLEPSTISLSEAVLATTTRTLRTLNLGSHTLILPCLLYALEFKQSHVIHNYFVLCRSLLSTIPLFVKLDCYDRHPYGLSRYL